jgi:competence protein ComEC
MLQKMVFEAPLELKNLFLWIPVAMAVGILIYFSLSFEPNSVFFVIIALVLPILGWISLKPTIKAPQKIGILALFFCLLGFWAAELRTKMVDAPILDRAIGPLQMVGQVEHIEQLSEREWRLIVRPNKLGRLSEGEMPYRIRLRSRTGMPNTVVAGQWIEALVRIMPPPGPSQPQDHDFSRDAYFARVGGTGFTLSNITLTGASYDASGGFYHFLNRMRNKIKGQINKSISGQSAAIATALTTGLRGAISDETTFAMRGAGLAHLLAISGLHMALVTGILFISVRVFLAAIPALALNLPIKQISALCAWLGGLSYYFLSGGSISTARAFLMVTIVLVAIFLNRKPISMRLVAFAAMVILLTSPEALLSPGFQMSFSAVIALVAGFEYLAPRLSTLKYKVGGLKGTVLVYVLSVLLSTLIAEFSIGPIAAWHFQIVTLYGLLANLLAVPFMAFLVMPLGVLAMILAPLGLDAFLWPLMGWGIDQILAIATWTVSLPHAVFNISPLGTGFILFFGISLVWITFIKQVKLKTLAFIPLSIAIGFAIMAPPMADILISSDGKLIAIKGPDKAYYFNDLRTGRFARSKWIQQNNEGGTAFRFTELLDVSNKNNPNTNNVVNRFFECDFLSCVYQKGPVVIGFSILPEALEEDCQRVDLIITKLSVPRNCSPPLGVIGNWQLITEGAHSIRIDESSAKVIILSSYKARGNRPWVKPKPFNVESN